MLVSRRHSERGGAPVLQLCPCLFCFPLTDIPRLYASPYTTELGFGNKQCLAVVGESLLSWIALFGIA